MERFQHCGHGVHLLPWGDGEDIPVKMDCAALISGIWEHFRYSLQHPEVFVTDDESDTGKPLFFQTHKERAADFPVFFHALGGIDGLTEAVIVDIDRHKDGDILDLIVSATPEIHTIYIDIRVLPSKRAGTPCRDLFICFFVDVTDRSG